MQTEQQLPNEETARSSLVSGTQVHPLLVAPSDQLLPGGVGHLLLHWSHARPQDLTAPLHSLDQMKSKLCTTDASMGAEAVHLYTHINTLIHTHSLHTNTLSLSHTQTYTHYTHSLCLSLSHTHTHSHTLSHAHALSHTQRHTHSHISTQTQTHSLSFSLSHTHKHLSVFEADINKGRERKWQAVCWCLECDFFSNETNTTAGNKQQRSVFTTLVSLLSPERWVHWWCCLRWWWS